MTNRSNASTCFIDRFARERNVTRYTHVGPAVKTKREGKREREREREGGRENGIKQRNEIR